MKNIVKNALVMSAMLLAISLNVSAQHESDLKRQIEQLNQEMSEALVSGDLEKNLSFYTRDVISLPNYQPMLTGIEELRKSNEEMKNAGMTITAFSTRTINVISGGNYITETGTFNISFAMKGQESPVNDSGKYLTVWERQADGALKIKVETWNSDRYPGMEEKQ